MDIKNSHRLDGKIVRGFGVAVKSIPVQLEFLSSYVPELRNCFPATINVQLDSELHIRNWPVVTSPFAWSDRFPDYQEVFRLSPVEFQYNHLSYPAWLYLSDGSHHRSESASTYFEIITQKIPLINTRNCSIYVDGTLIEPTIQPESTKTGATWKVKW